MSKMQCTTRRICSKRDLFKTLTSMNIRMGFPYQSDSMHHARDVFEGICNRMILHFYIIANMGFWSFVMTGQALLMSPKGRNASRDGLVKLWEEGFYYLQYYHSVK